MTRPVDRPTDRPPDPALDGPGVGPVVRRFLARPYASLQLLITAGIGLLCFGFLMSVSTTIAAARDNGGTGSIWNQAVKEVLFIGLGLVLFWFAVRMTPRRFRLLAYPAVVVAAVSLVAVLVPGIGVGVYGARRWIDIGPLQLQPSEFAKFAMLLWAADLLARKQHLGTLTRARHLFVPLLPGFVLVVALVMLEPDLGTTLCFMLVLLGVLWMIGMPARYFGAVVALVGVAVTVLAVTEPYRLQRLTAFVHPFQDMRTSGYHTVEGLYALASGGLFGVGLGQGTSKYGWVPNANSDYVFAIIGEELGLVGCIAVLLLFGLLAFTGMRIARRSVDPFVRIACGGATIWLVGQAVINIGYVSGLLPVTGIPLPLISAGGTSLLVTFFVIGMLASFARHERDAVNSARRAERLGRRSRVERWLAIPVPRVYVAPRRRPRGAATASRGERSNAPAGPTRSTPRAPASTRRAPSGGAGRGRGGSSPVRRVG